MWWLALGVVRMSCLSGSRRLGGDERKLFNFSVVIWIGMAPFFFFWEKLYTGALYPRISGLFLFSLCFQEQTALRIGYYNSLRTRLHYSIMITIFQHLHPLTSGS